MTKSTRGGSRQNSGRPKKEATKTVAFRVKLRHVDKIKEMVKASILEIEKGEQLPASPPMKNKTQTIP